MSSFGGVLLTERRRQMIGDHVQEALYLRSWEVYKIIHLRPELFDEIIRYADSAPTSGQLVSNTIESDKEV